MKFDLPEKATEEEIKIDVREVEALLTRAIIKIKQLSPEPRA